MEAINFNALSIEHETAKSVLIKMPNNSEWQGYTFWHPSKMRKDVKVEVKGISRLFSYTDNWEFTIFKSK